MKVSDKLIKKYSKSGPRYTSYPPATFFDSNFSNEDFKKKIIESNNENPQNTSNPVKTSSKLVQCSFKSKMFQFFIIF